MKEYKVEARTYYSKISLDKNHIVKSSTEEIQAIIDDYTSNGWKLSSTDTTLFFYNYPVLSKEKNKIACNNCRKAVIRT